VVSELEVIERQIEVFREAAARSARGHCKAAESLEAWHRRLGVPVVLLSAVVATSIFATVAADPALGWKILTGLLSLAAAMLASLNLLRPCRQGTRPSRCRGGSAPRAGTPCPALQCRED
jgi:hypothetical protein